MARLLLGNGRFDVPVVGTSFCQSSIREILSFACWDGIELDCLAALLPHETNPHDPLAVGVLIVFRDGSTKAVGYLSRRLARDYRKALPAVGGQDDTGMVCRARVLGDIHNRPGGYQAVYGIRLDLRIPLRLGTVRAWRNWEKRLL